MNKGVVLLRVLLVAINASYVQTNLAVRYLREAVRNEFPDIMLKEFTINESLSAIVGEIFECKADIICFSCYIWNISEILKITRDLRLVLPKVRFVLGGPEVSFETQELIHNNSELDAVIQGEGEIAFLELLQSWKAGREPDNIPGIVWRCRNEIISNPKRSPLRDLNKLPDPYLTEEQLENRLVYVETSRGCPFNCQYCLSSVESGVRFLEPERFRHVFIRLLKYGARTIKFIDRTFNVRKEHAFCILNIVREEYVNAADPQLIRIHCEMSGELLDEEWLAYLTNYPQGLLQLEIGVQSTNQFTLESISRCQNFEFWCEFIRKLRLTTEIPLHLDLIAGLPGENWEDFRSSFNDVYQVQPNMLQLGFLKVLKGSGLRHKAKQLGFVYQSGAPYSILQTKDLSYSEILRLKRIETILDKYYNSARFSRSLCRIIPLFPTAFDFYDSLAGFWDEQNWFGSLWKEKALFERLWLYIDYFSKNKLLGEEKIECLRDALRFDYFYRERPGVVPDYLWPAAKMPFGSLEEAGKALNEVKRRSFEEYKSLLVKKLTEDSEDILVSLVESMSRQQWSRCTAVAYFSAPVRNELCDAIELEQEIDGSGYNIKYDPVLYLFLYQKNKVWAFQINNAWNN
ncbi:MAG: B12-binding domain-containing radical SAM protein [Desulfitobacteriaceae bacterium]|nr:B12-binding domain-containing radical SAM protein [Desulfitobacteriaceae bacterium]MDD4345626.1 B12-binding domain-containing radical SAM protein [Desulfitobacteriaceae bacterium]MDD4400443.1 B12-binding domain-containing radical SAM protein [Desulfitobacteriaceae bacterium]